MEPRVALGGSEPGQRLSEEESRQTIRVEKKRRSRYLLRQLFSRPTFIFCLLVLVFWIISALCWRWMVPYDPYGASPADVLAGPSSSHWLGTDELGRDALSRMLAGAATVLTIAPAAVALSMLLGTLIGLGAAYYRGFIDDALMRTVDVLIAVPALLIAVMVLSALGPSVIVLILVIAVLYAPMIGRTVRAAALGERSKDYVAAAQLRGERGPFVMFVEILPNISGPLVVEATLRLGYAVFTCATLSFLGLGLNPPSADWGVTVAAERSYLQVQPLAVLAPALALGSLVLAVNFIADNLRSVMSED
jgi:peptide/nickel transport system permease protein